MGVLQSKTFSHTPDEAMSVDWQKLVITEILFCYREIELINTNTVYIT